MSKAFYDYSGLPEYGAQSGEVTAISSDKMDGLIELNKAITQLQLADTDAILKLSDSLGVSGKSVANYFNKISYIPDVGAGEKPVKLILADELNPIVGSFTSAGLGLVIQEVGSGATSVGVLDLICPNKSVESYNSWLDRMRGATGIAPEFGGDNSMLPNIRALDRYTIGFTPGLWGGRISLGSKIITYGREMGTRGLGDRGIGQIVAYNTEYLYTQNYTRKKSLLVDMLWKNGYTYAGTTQATNIPEANFIEMYESMGTLNADGSVTYSTTDPTYTPLIAITNVCNHPLVLKYRKAIAGVLMADADLQAIMNHPNIKGVTNLFLANSQGNGLKVKVGDITREIATYYAPGFDIPLLSDSDVWENQNTDGTPNNASQQFFVPRGTMMLVLDFSKMDDKSQRQLAAFHLCYNEVDPNTEAPAMGFFAGAFSRNLNNSNTVNQLDLVVSLSGNPAAYMPEAMFFLTGLYSNVTVDYKAGAAY